MALWIYEWVYSLFWNVMKPWMGKEVEHWIGFTSGQPSILLRGGGTPPSNPWHCLLVPERPELEKWEQMGGRGHWHFQQKLDMMWGVGNAIGFAKTARFNYRISVPYMLQHCSGGCAGLDLLPFVTKMSAKDRWKPTFQYTCVCAHHSWIRKEETFA